MPALSLLMQVQKLSVYATYSGLSYVQWFHGILFGRDQLTRKRAETAKHTRKNSTTPTTKLEGLILICEDWHAKKVFLEVC